MRKRRATSEKNGAAWESALRITGKPFLHGWNCPGCDPQSFPALRGKTSSGAPCRSRRQLPPTRRSPSRASQRLTMCQRLLSTPCAWNQAYRPRERQESVALHTLSEEDVVGHVATRQSPPRAAQQLTTCQLRMSTPCNWNQAYGHNFLAGCIVNFMRTSGTPCRNRRHHTPAPGVSQCNQPSPRRPRRLAFRSRLAAGRRRSRPCLAESSCLRIEIAPTSGIQTVSMSQCLTTASVPALSLKKSCLRIEPSVSGVQAASISQVPGRVQQSERAQPLCEVLPRRRKAARFHGGITPKVPDTCVRQME